MGTRLDKFERSTAWPAGWRSPCQPLQASGFGLLAEDSNPGPLLPLVHLMLSFQFEGRRVSLALRSRGGLQPPERHFRSPRVPGPGCASPPDTRSGGNIGVASVFFHAAHPEARLWRWKRSPPTWLCCGRTFVSQHPRPCDRGRRGGPARQGYVSSGAADNSSFVRQPWMRGDTIEWTAYCPKSCRQPDGTRSTC